jgi:hypothetical protein
VKGRSPIDEGGERRKLKGELECQVAALSGGWGWSLTRNSTESHSRVMAQGVAKSGAPASVRVAGLGVPCCSSQPRPTNRDNAVASLVSTRPTSATPSRVLGHDLDDAVAPASMSGSASWTPSPGPHIRGVRSRGNHSSRGRLSAECLKPKAEVRRVRTVKWANGLL